MPLMLYFHLLLHNIIYDIHWTFHVHFSYVSPHITAKPTTCDHINIKYICCPHGKPYGDPALITYRDLQKVNTLNKYNFHIFIYYKETTKNFKTHIN